MVATSRKVKEKVSPGTSTTRLNIVLSQQNRERINRIVEMMGADTVTEVVKDALRLLEYFLKVSDGGGKILIQMPGEEPKQLEIFGVSTK